MFIAFSAECKLSASFLECTQCQMLSDLAVFTSNREECAKHCVWCGYFQSGAETEVEFTVKVFISTPRTEDTGPAYGVHTGANSTPLEGPAHTDEAINVGRPLRKSAWQSRREGTRA
jgi:Zn ribbon nucleic-acid-binding protein